MFPVHLPFPEVKLVDLANHVSRVNKHVCTITCLGKCANHNLFTSVFGVVGLRVWWDLRQEALCCCVGLIGLIRIPWGPTPQLTYPSGRRRGKVSLLRAFALELTFLSLNLNALSRLAVRSCICLLGAVGGALLAPATIVTLLTPPSK